MSPRLRRRASQVVGLLTVLLMLLGLAACQTAARRAPSPRDQVMFDRLASARKAAQGLAQARETLMYLESGHVQKRLARLRGEVPATPEEIDAAFRTLKTAVVNLEAAPNWTPAPVYHMVRRVGKIEIDGRLEESAWRRAQPVELRYPLLPDQAGTPPYATARLLWDQQFLYAAFDATDDVVVAPPMKRDSPVYQFDCVELFLMPDRGLGSYWELNISPSGAVMDHSWSKYHDRFFSYRPMEMDVRGLRHASRIRRDGYSVEIAVPLADLPGLGESPEPGRPMWLVMAHADRDEPDGPLSFFAHGQMLHSFHNIWTMPQAVFVDDAP